MPRCSPVLAAAALASLALSGPCSAAQDEVPPSTARTETIESEPVSAPIGVEETAHLPGSRLLARFVRVVEDSRCPVGVTCVWAGRALVELEVSIENSEAPSHLVTLEVGGEPVEVYGAHLAAVRLEPAPRVDPPVAPEEYRLSLGLVEDGPSNPSTTR